MDLTFLRTSDGTPLTKTFSLSEKGQLQKSPYPNSYHFVSKTVSVDSIRDVYDRMRYYAPKGYCMLKGAILKELHNESRAGSTAPDTPTHMLVCDFDAVGGVSTSDAALAMVGIQDTTHIAQFSSSSGLSDTKYHAHCMLMIDGPVSPRQIKNWAMWVNLTTPELASQITLTRSMNALRWPFDISVNQNDKLIYLTPPRFEAGIEDPHKNERLHYHQRSHQVLSASLFRDIDPDQLEKLKIKKLNELRRAAGLPTRRKTSTKMYKGQAVGSNPVQATVTGVREDRGFVYVNLNGGDSWAYYFPMGNPEILYNFKGEQNYALKEIAPDLHREYLTKSQEWLVEQNEKALTSRKTGKSYLAFLDKVSDTYYRGYYDHDADDLQIVPTNSLVKVHHFLKQHAQPIGDFVPEWNLVFNFGSDVIFDPDQRTINVYKRTPYLRDPQPGEHPTIDSLIRHVVGNDENAFNHFMNWLAYLIKHRRPPRTAWVLYGVQGTGKGVLFNHVLSPLIGREYVAMKRLDELEQDFNAYLRKNLLLWIDEAQISDAKHLSRAMAKINNLVVEPTISIRAMRTDSYMVDNHTSVIFASNKPDPIEIVPTDRRMNVAKFQPEKLRPTKTFIKLLAKELFAFAHTLLNYDVSEDDARTPMESEDKEKIKYLTRNSIDLFADAIRNGDLQYFFEALPSDEIRADEFDLIDSVKQNKYRMIIAEFFDKVSENKDHRATVRVTRDNLRFIASYLLDRVPTSPNKFTAFMKYHDIVITPLRINGRTVQGVEVTFEAPSYLINEWNNNWAGKKPLKAVK